MEPQVAELFPTPSSFTSVSVVLAHFLLGKEFLLMLNTLHLDSIHQTVTLSVPENCCLGQLSRDLRALCPIYCFEIFKVKPTVFSWCRWICLNWSKIRTKPGERPLNYILLGNKSEYLYLVQQCLTMVIQRKLNFAKWTLEFLIEWLIKYSFSLL